MVEFADPDVKRSLEDLDEPNLVIETPFQWLGIEIINLFDPGNTCK